MSITLKMSKVRPSENVPFYTFSKEYIDLQRSNPNITRTINAVDPTTVEVTLTFSNKDVFDAWKTNPIVVSEISKSKEYSNLIGITRTIEKVITP